MSKRSRKATPLSVWLSLSFVVLLGAGFGVALGGTVNIMRNENFTEFKSALPTKLYDIKGRLITEFFSEEKRNPVPIRDLPPHLIGAFLTREDKTFYTHRGFTVKSIARAVVGKLIGKNLGGGSVISQQLAGDLYDDRKDISLRRKLVELWWSLQIERRFSKPEILEMYLNRTIMGAGGLYGVEAASQYFFNHPAKDCTPAESAILAIQLAGPTLYSPFKNPQNAMARSKVLLEQMVKNKVLTKAEAEASFSDYWDNFDYRRVASSAFYMREDKAPWFSEYVRRQLEDDLLYGSADLYSDGLSVYTTLDLDQQVIADAYMKRGIERANTSYKNASSQRLSRADDIYTPIVELLGLSFNFHPLVVSDSKSEAKSYEFYSSKINPTLDALSLMFGMSNLKVLTNSGTAKIKTGLEKTIVEGSLVTIDNTTGYITTLIGGSNYGASNQLIRATQSNVMPGSTFKPLYYSAAIDSRKVTEGTLIYDTPTIFYNEDGTPYIPLNFKGEWKGKVLAWNALAHSMNVPSVKVLDTVGFDAAIQRAAALLGITDPKEIRRTFPRLYPLGLGVIGVTPMQMTRAFSVFANGGKAVEPIAIRYVEDRNSNIILEPEKEMREKLRKMGGGIQLISPQNAAVMTDMLKRVVWSGTLAGATGSGASMKQKDGAGNSYTIPLGGKTGTTQNWADAWTVGFSPYYTTAIWFGFDRGGNSLGVEQTGATIAAPIWADFMRDIHKGLPYKNFPAPQSGLVNATVCSVSGLLPTKYCDEGTVNLLYLDGTQPIKSCDIHKDKTEDATNLFNMITGSSSTQESGTALTVPDSAITLPELDTTIKIDLPSF
ncbi:MAG TPA: PBP1A family penicillin-binding protein [Rectinemataceae bacterium]|nr:PBP1A family penicillin-binding protein [Rectinemataceae bacterium]